MRTKMSAVGMCIVIGIALLVAAPASAVPPSPSAVSCSTDLVLSGLCDTQLMDLCNTTETAQSPPLKLRDKDGLVGKVVMASMKLSLGKIGDAELKLLEYEEKLEALAGAAKAKIDEGDADLLATLLLQAQVCVASIP